ncbi:ATP-dependent helicase, partial [Kitasatospora sp. NPDC048239]
ITPVTTRVSAGDEELARITGARTPTGVPVVIADPVVERPRRSASTSRGRRNRPPYAERNTQGGGGSGGAGGGGRRRAPRRVALAA